MSLAHVSAVIRNKLFVCEVCVFCIAFKEGISRDHSRAEAAFFVTDHYTCTKN